MKISLQRFQYPAICFTLATCYVFTGFLCALVRIKGQYPDPFWIPAGVALSGMVLVGIKYWPGVFVGAFIYNSYHVMQQADSYSGISIALVMAVGATLQAVAGVWICEKLGEGMINRLDTGKSIWRFLLFTGPVACLISPTIGTIALLVQGGISVAGAINDWFFWWCGDSIGVLLGAPFSLIIFGEPASVWRARKLTVAVPLMGASVVLFLALSLAFHVDASRINSDFQNSAKLFTSTFQNESRGLEDEVSLLAEFFRSSDEVTPDEFDNFAGDICRRYPIIFAVAWSPKVIGPDLKKYKPEARQSEGVEYTDKRVVNDRSLPSGEDKHEQFPIQYVYPLQDNQRVLGFDLSSIPKLHEAIDNAKRDMRPLMIRNVGFLEKSLISEGALIISPVVRRVATSEPDILGVVSAIVPINRLVGGVMRALNSENIGFEIKQLAVESGVSILFSTDKNNKADGYRFTSELELGGQPWEITFWPTNDYLRQNSSASILFLESGTLVFSILLSAFLLMVTGRSIRIEEQVAERTKELEASRDQVLRGGRLLTESVNSVANGFIIYDQDDRLVMVNNAFRTYFQGGEDLFVPGASFEQILRAQIRLGMYDLDGQDEERWLDHKVAVHHAADGEPVERHLSDGRWLMTVERRTPSGFIAGNRIDITEIKQAILQIHDQNLQLDTLFRLSPDGLVVISAQKIIVFINPSFLAATGLASHEVLGRSYSVLESELKKRMVNENACVDFHQLFGTAGEAPKSFVLKLRFPKLTTIKLVGVSNKSSQAPYLLYGRDVTLETELDEMKSEFLSHAAHELRTPLTSIYGYSELLLQRDFDESVRRDLLESIFQQSAWLTEIINELLDLSRIDERRGKDFKPEICDLKALVVEAVSAFSGYRDKWPMFVTGLNGPVLISADQAKSRQAIINVLGNARKYSPEGGEIRIEILSDGHYYGVGISDQGLGMSYAEVSRVTERFWRSDRSGVSPGTGLGMAIVREILEIHGGRLEVQSAINVGTTVTLLWPKNAQIEIEDKLAEPS